MRPAIAGQAGAALALGPLARSDSEDPLSGSDETMTQEAARELLELAIAQTQLSARAFSHVMSVDERTIRRWLAGERDVPGPVIQLCRLLVSDPQLVLMLGTEEVNT